MGKEGIFKCDCFQFVMFCFLPGCFYSALSLGVGSPQKDLKILRHRIRPFFKIKKKFYIVVVFAIRWHESAMDLHVFPIPIPPPASLSNPILLGLPSAPALSIRLMHPTRAGDLFQPLIVYLFQCGSLWTSHPRLLPQSPRVCSVHLCLFFCFAYRVIILMEGNNMCICSPLCFRHQCFLLKLSYSWTGTASITEI